MQSFDQSFGLLTHRRGGIDYLRKAKASQRILDPEDPLPVHEPDGFCSHIHPSVGEQAEERAFDHLSCLHRIIVDALPQEVIHVGAKTRIG